MRAFLRLFVLRVHGYTHTITTSRLMGRLQTKGHQMNIPRGRPHYRRGQQDPKTAEALALVARGMSQRKAAAAAGVSLSTVVRAIQRHRAIPAAEADQRRSEGAA